MSNHPVQVRLYAWFDDLTGDYVTAKQITKFLAAQKANPTWAAELDNYSDALVFDALRQAITSHRNSVRHAARAAAAKQTTRKRMADAAANIAAGVPHGMFDDTFKVDEKNTRRPVAKMTGPDHAFVAGRYLQQSKRNGLFAAFHRTVSRKIGNRQTDEVYSPAQYEALYQRLVADQLVRRPDAA